MAVSKQDAAAAEVGVYEARGAPNMRSREQDGKKVGRKIELTVENASRSAANRDTCIHDIHARYTNENRRSEGDGASLLAVSWTRERRREDRETEEVEECALSVIGAARRCIVPAVGMKTREFSQLYSCAHNRRCAYKPASQGSQSPRSKLSAFL